MTERPLRLLLVAGEVSGDQHATALLHEIKRRVPDVEVTGVGGEGCRSHGMRLLAHQKDLAVVGLVEALGKIRFARRLIRSLVAEAQKSSYDGAILIDSPDFNLPLARRLEKAGVPVVFYVSPQVWAWRSGRAKAIARIGRAILVLFRFEKRWYDARGLGKKVSWVGHPLVDAARDELATPHEAPRDGRQRLVLMPGSRSGEIHRNLPAMRDAAERLRAARPDLDVVLIRADSVPTGLLREVAGPALDAWRVVEGPHLALLAASDVLLVASGTATIEGLLTGIPMVVVYRVNRLTYAIAKRIVKVKDVAMANLLTDDGTGRTVPELIQHDATPERIAAEAAAFLDDPARRQRCRERLALGAAELGEPGAGARAAEAVLAAFGRTPA